MSKIKSYNFWIKLVSAIILIARIILSKFGYELDSALVLDIATLVAGLLVVMGIINEPTGITFSYEELATNGNKNQNKGESNMVGKIKTDLLEKVKELSQMIENSGGDMSGVIELLTIILGEVISSEEVQEDNDLKGEENIEEVSKDIIVEDNKIEQEKTDLGGADTIEPIVVTENFVEMLAEDEEEELGVVEPVETASEAEATSENHKFETAYSVAKGNPSAEQLVKEYILSHIDEIVGSACN